MIHVVIVKIVESKSHDSDLEGIVKHLKTKIRYESSDKLTMATLSTVVCVAEKLLQHKSMLLPTACTTHYSESEDQLYLTSESLIKFSSRWLLKRLILPSTVPLKLQMCSQKDWYNTV